MESTFGTLVVASLALALAFALGYGPVTLLLPAQHRELRWAAMPATGYLTFCLLVMVISGNLYRPVAEVVLPACGMLLVLGAGVFHWQWRRKDIGPARRHVRLLALLMAPTLLVITGPALLQSSELYLGSANLDFYQSLIYQEVLRRYDLPVFGVYHAPTDAHSALLATKVWPDSPQARFGGVMFSYLLQSLTSLSAKTTLTTTLVIFAVCVPLSFYLFSRVVMGMSERGATLCAMLVGVSSPLALSFLYILVGQGSGLPILPLLIAVLFLSMRESSPRLLAYAAVLVAGLFWLYAMMLPFALAPMGLVALYLMVRRRLSFWWALAILLGVAGGMALAWSGMLEQLAAFLRGLAEVSGRLVGTLFFVDFLTEMFFVYLLGITTYPSSNSIVSGTVYQLAGEGVPWYVVIILTGWVLAFYLASFRAWFRHQADDARRAAMICIAFVYAAVWAQFTFNNPYGYSTFKMTAWLQFLVLPVLAFGLLHYWQHRAPSISGRVLRWAALSAGFFFVGANVLASIDYGVMSYGRDRDRGYVVNAFGLGNNPDVPRLGEGVSTIADAKSKVGIGFTDSVQNNWAAYQLLGRMPHSILSHEQLPEDDAFLPDPVTGYVRDTSGVLKRIDAVEYADVRNDYYLLPGPDNLNPEITQQDLPRPAWGNGTYQLQKGDQLADFLYLGRGFYRSEFPRSGQPWWQPKPASRWSSEGGEFYILQASQPGEPYRLKLTAMVGFGVPSASRTLELYHGGVKFDELRITNTARVISKPFFPAGKLDKVTMVVREKTLPMKRRAAIWSRGLPEDTRSLNIQVSSVQVIAPGRRPVPTFEGRLAGIELLEKADLFDGLSADAWVGARASIAYVAPAASNTATLQVLVPGNLGFAFPFKVTIVTDGVEHHFSAKHPGKLKMDVPLQTKARGDVVTLEIRPQTFKDVDNDFARANRPLLQSVHLESIEFALRP